MSQTHRTLLAMLIVLGLLCAQVSAYYPADQSASTGEPEAMGLISPGLTEYRGEIQCELEKALERGLDGWTVKRNPSRHISFTATGKPIELTGDSSDRGNAVQTLVSSFIDFERWNLNEPTVISFGELTRVDFSQTRDGYCGENAGIHCVLDARGRLSFLTVELLDLSVVQPHILWTRDQATQAIESEFRSYRPERVQFEDIAYTEAADGKVHLTYRFLVNTGEPIGAHLAYVDAGSGEIVKQQDVLLRFNGDIDGHISGAWKEMDESDPFTFGSFAAASYRVGYEPGTPGVPPLAALGSLGGSFTETGELFSNDTGYYHYTSKVGVDEYYFKYFMGNDVCLTLVDDGSGNFVRPFAVSDTFNIVDSLSFTLDFDWTETQLLLDHPEYYKDLNIAYHLKKMHTWYADWLGEDLAFERVAVKAHLTGGWAGYFVPGEIGIDTYSGYNTYVIYHEMAHQVAYHSILLRFGSLPTWWNEGQADYFASDLRNTTPVFDYSYYVPNWCGVQTDHHKLGGTQSGSWWQIRSALGSGYTDSLVFYSSAYDISTPAQAVRSLLLADDDNGDLSDSTPNAGTICSAYADHWLGPHATLVFMKDGDILCVDQYGTHYPAHVNLDPVTWQVLDTYPWDFLVWDFGDGTPADTSLAPVHAYTDWGTYYITCTAHYPWGQNVETQEVIVEGICGDVDYSGFVDSMDEQYLHDYLYSGGPAPVPWISGDVNCDTKVNVSDLCYLIDYLYSSGPEPCANCGGMYPKPAAERLAADVEISLSFNDGVTTVSLSTPYNLRALQLELVGNSDAAPVNLIEDGVAMAVWRSEETVTVGLFDRKGSRRVPAGSYEVIRVRGDFTLTEVVVVDTNNYDLTLHPSGAGEDRQLPTTFALEQNHPNPFNPTTNVSFGLPVASEVRLRVYNTLGQQVATLVDGRLEAGVHTVAWDASHVASGVYLYRLEAGDFVQTKKMVLLK
ncbi:MAG TPA: T9SS type A sorting domain-containing protein [Acidobacteriota bacterium]|nr:T9SS type A sorting domain-containing protein [Acidobacteriota bacterium]